MAMTIDTKNLVREIENRKEIWDIPSEEYSDHDLKRSKW